MHNIHHWDLEENCDRREVVLDIQDYAESEGDGYSGPMHWHDEVQPLKNREEAEKWIEEHDRGWYDDHAVRYIDNSQVVTKKVEDLQKRFSETALKISEYEREHSIKNLKAEYIGCQKCGSRLKRSLIVGERCPLCRNDLRSETTKKALEGYHNKQMKIVEQIKEEQAKHKGKIKWLVKFEFHS